MNTSIPKTSSFQTAYMDKTHQRIQSRFRKIQLNKKVQALALGQ